MFDLKADIAINIGHSSFKIVKLDEKNENCLEKFCIEKNEHMLNLFSTKESRITDLKNVSMFIKNIMKKNKISGKDVVVVIPDDLVVTKMFFLNIEEDEEKTKSEISAKLSSTLPLPLSKWNWSYQIVEQADLKNLAVVEVILRSNMIEIERLIRRAGLNPIVIDIDSFNIMNYFYSYLSKTDNHGKNIGIVNLSHNSTTTAIYKNTVLKAIQTKQLGSDDFTKQLASGLGKSYAEAEKLKHESTIFLPQFIPEQDEVAHYKIIKSVFGELVRTIFNLFEYYLDRFRETRIDEIIITGGGANFKNIEIQLSGHLNTHVIQGNTIIPITKKGKDSTMVSLHAQSSLSAAIGALQREV